MLCSKEQNASAIKAITATTTTQGEAWTILLIQKPICITAPCPLHTPPRHVNTCCWYLPREPPLPPLPTPASSRLGQILVGCPRERDLIKLARKTARVHPCYPSSRTRHNLLARINFLLFHTKEGIELYSLACRDSQPSISARTWPATLRPKAETMPPWIR